MIIWKNWYLVRNIIINCLFMTTIKINHRHRMLEWTRFILCFFFFFDLGGEVCALLCAIHRLFLILYPRMTNIDARGTICSSVDCSGLGRMQGLKPWTVLPLWSKISNLVIDVILLNIQYRKSNKWKKRELCNPMLYNRIM